MADKRADDSGRFEKGEVDGYDMEEEGMAILDEMRKMATYSGDFGN